MSEQGPPRRVRVTGPDRRARPIPRTGDIDEASPLGGVYLGSLLREQLWLAARVLGLLTVTVGGLPLLFFLAPGLDDVRVAGAPVAWLVLGVLVYPWLVLLGWHYVRRAERNERDFAELMGEVER
ncbi:hypothetical protein FE634_02010 [Nocardioides dongxiaopingii]|uniref:hypothetical protein n=1 Tax=Nocardioides TaxID=1839 RepID=UPI0010C76C40|nr:MULTISPECIES: hypothetical protein [Nocardioides]QDH10630.1 hypothetical protein FE634_02010 [Nocardioides sp. S-1144]